MKIDMTKPSHENCPSFEVCQTNACPLHKDYHKTLFTIEGDKTIEGWRKCRSDKTTRMKIATVFKLKNQGLTEKEQSNLRQSIKMKEQILSTRENVPTTPNPKGGMEVSKEI